MRRLAILDAMLAVVFCLWLFAAMSMLAPLFEREAQAVIPPPNSCLPPAIPGGGCPIIGNGCPFGCAGTGFSCQTTPGGCPPGPAGCSVLVLGFPCLCNAFSC